MVKNLPDNAGDLRPEFVPGSVRSPGGGHGNPLQYSCLESPMDREAWRATVHGVTKNQTRLSDFNRKADTATHIWSTGLERKSALVLKGLE